MKDTLIKAPQILLFALFLILWVGIFVHYYIKDKE
jgi:hypothetical protein